MADIPGNTTSTATFSTTATAGSFSGQSEFYNDVDYIRISLTAGETLSFFVHADGATNLPDFGIQASIVNSAGQTQSVTDFPVYYAYHAAAFTFTAQTTGTYFLAVSGYDQRQPMEYVASFSRNPLVTTILDGNTPSSPEYSGRVVGNYANNQLSLSSDPQAPGVEAFGAGGDDTINGNSGDNILWGGLGDDDLFGKGGSDTFFGDEGNDYISAFRSTGTNRAFGGVGHDYLEGGSGNDFLYGEDGNDLLVGSDGADRLDGGSGDNSYSSVDAEDQVFDSSGTDTFLIFATQFSLASYSSIENLIGTNLNGQRLTGNQLHNLIVGDDGNDTLDGGKGGNDLLEGNEGRDSLLAWSGNDTFDGGADDDVINFVGWTAAVTLNLALASQSLAGATVKIISVEGAVGGNGNDTFHGTGVANMLSGGLGGNDTLNGLGGNDIFYAWSGVDVFNGGDGTDDIVTFDGWSAAVNINLELTTAQSVGGSNSVKLSSIENAVGGNGNDTLRGTSGANFLGGGGGNDTFRAWSGADTFSGGTGDDTISFVGWGSGVTVNLDSTEAQTVSGGSVTFDSIENAVGGNGGDTFFASGVKNQFTGGAGNDTFVFTHFSASFTAARDVITDFNSSGDDTINLSGIDPFIGTANNETFAYAGQAGASPAAGSVSWFQSGGNTYVVANIDPAGPVFMIELLGLKTLTGADFVL